LLPASAALAQDALPIGLTDNIILTRPVAVGRVLTWADVALDEHDDVVSLRREMERTFR
jgi:predicted homoserine dehydrogenase-like protein